ncbi:uncharacterized protein LOC116302023 [Actinia tenebrosa]|uniref:Uncharacterized protein LOC116302023 n=1 Tax=Actinia tenebrosa TaxID=6105 RepID=A0A6P8IJY5_ACTTE|nr:uncharacterized protein LOC116302023 [Actinia tenebrosa]
MRRLKIKPRTAQTRERVYHTPSCITFLNLLCCADQSMSFLRKRIERYNRKARRPAEPKKTLKEKTHLDSLTGSSEDNEKEQEYDSDLSSDYDGGPAHGFYNQISNMKLKKELTANKIRLLREAKRYDRMMNHLMREVQRLNALVRSLMQRNSNMDRPTKRQKAAKNEKKEQKVD